METQDSIRLSDISNFLEQGAFLRGPEKCTLIWGPFKASATPIKHEISIFCPDFYDLEKASYWQGAQSGSLPLETLKSMLEAYVQAQGGAAKPLWKASWRQPSREEYACAFHRIQNKIQRGEIRKAVPTAYERSTCTVNSLQRAQIILNLLTAPSSLYVHGFWDDEGGVLGATPETLFVISGTHLSTMALAGTCPKSDDSSRPSLLEDPKEREEHDLVAQDIVEVLSSYGQVQSDGPALLELPTLWHLKTKIELALDKPVDCRELICRLHPTPALGVFPRAAGYHWMQEDPGQEGRARFGAPFAFLFPNEEVVCLVAIRNLQWNRNESLIGSGGGVVASSELDREWRELQKKRESVKKILGLEE